MIGAATTRVGSGIPSATNIDHVGWSVPDLVEAVAFFVDVLGGDEILRAGPFADPEGDWMSSQFDVDARSIARIALVRLGSQQVIELLEWKTLDRGVAWALNSDVGASHLAVHVGDVAQAVRYLVEKGCSPCGEPITLSDVPHAGMTILYLRTPIGLTLELVSHPGRPLPYETSTNARLLPADTCWRNERTTTTEGGSA